MKNLNLKNWKLIFWVAFTTLFTTFQLSFGQNTLKVHIGYPCKGDLLKPCREWELTSLNFSTGETPLTSGNTFSAVMSKNNSILIADYNATLGEIIYLYTPEKTKWFSFGPSGGEVKNVFWFAPITTFTFVNGHFKLLNWVGWSLGDPEGNGTSTDVIFCFSYHQASILHKGFEAYYANQIYQKNDPEHIFGLKKNFELSKKISLSGGLGYMLNAEKYLWSTGINYNF